MAIDDTDAFLERRRMRRQVTRWRIAAALVAILVIAAILTPPDIISQIIVAGPLMLLYEIGIFISARNERMRLRESTSARLAGA